MISTLMEALAHKETEISTLKLSNEKLQEKVTEYRNDHDEVNSIRDQIQYLQKGFTEIESENNNLKIDNESYKKQIAELRQNKKTCDELQKKLDEKENINIVLQKELDYMKKTSKDQELENKQKELMQLKGKYEDKVIEVQKQAKMVVIAGEELSRLQREYKEYKASHDSNMVKLESKVNTLEKENSDVLSAFHALKTSEKDAQEKYKDTMNLLKRMQIDHESIRQEKDNRIMQLTQEVEIQKEKAQNASTSLINAEQLKEIYSEHYYMIYSANFMVSYTSTLEDLLVNFNTLISDIFVSGGENKVSDSFSLAHEHLKDIMFFIWRRGISMKKQSTNPTTTSNSTNTNTSSANDSNIEWLDGSDFNEDIIVQIVKDFLNQNTLIKFPIANLEIIEAFLNKINEIKVSDELLKGIKEHFIRKVEKANNFILSTLQAIFEKCVNIISCGSIKISNKKTIEFKYFLYSSFSLCKSILTLDNTKLTDSNAEYILNLIKYPSESIQRVHFYGAYDFGRICEKTVMRIYQSICSFCTDIIYLSVDSCSNLNTTIFSYLCMSIKGLTRLKILSFNNDNLKDDHIKFLSESLKNNKSVILLMLNNNLISSSGAFYLADCLSVNKTLQQLLLCSNNIQGNGLGTLLNVLATKNKTVNTLELRENHLTKDDFQYIGEFLKHNPVMECLDLSKNTLEMQGCVILGVAFEYAKQIKKLGLNEMGINSDLLPVIFKKIFVEEIYLDGNPLGEIGPIMLGNAIKNHQTLKKISLRRINMDVLGLSHILKNLRGSKVIKELHLEENKINQEMWNSIVMLSNGANYKIFIERKCFEGEEIQVIQGGNFPNLAIA